jgi:hypothetical protein
MSNDNNPGCSVSIGPGFFGCLFLVFLTLKLCNVINWSWWIVFAPLYAIPAIVLGILTFILLVTILVGVIVCFKKVLN